MDLLYPSTEETEQIIKQLINELSAFSRNDLLVQLSIDQCVEIEESSEEICLAEDSQITKIYKKSVDEFKETGASIFCVSSGVLKWDYLNSPTASPIFIYPATIKKDKVRGLYKVTYDQVEGFLNPFLVRHFSLHFDVNLSELILLKDDPTIWSEKLTELGFAFDLKGKLILGNFHHHRFSILRDLEHLGDLGHHLNSNIKEILTGSKSTSCDDWSLTSRLVIPANDEQTDVLNDLGGKNLVVQGPPGTGKSQLLTNVLSKAMFGGYHSLVVSEKRVALEVILDRLKTYQLDRFSFLPESSKSSRQLIHQLKSNWQWMESFEPLVSHHLDLSGQHVDALQLKLNILGKEDLIGGVSFTNYQELIKNLESVDEGVYNGNTASIVEFTSKKNLIENLYSLDLHKLTKYIPQNLISEDRILSFENNVISLEKRWLEMSRHFTLDNKNDLADLMRKAAFARLMANEIHQPYFRTLNPSKSEFNRFDKYYKQILKNNKELELFQDQLKNWKIQPSKEEAQGLLERLDKVGVFQRFKVRKKLNQLLHSPFIDPKRALTKWVAYCDLLTEKLKLEAKLLTIGIEDERQLEWVHSMQLKIRKEDYELWRSNSMVENTQMADQNAELHILYQNVRSFLSLEENDSFSEFFQLFNSKFSEFVKHRTELENLSDSLYKQLGQHENISSIESSILKSNWTLFISQFPAFKNFETQKLHETIEEIIDLQNHEYKDFASKVQYRIHQRWDQYQKLLLIGTKKLKKEERLLKERLKAGRSILIKEFGKTRSHPTVRELMNSDARVWIDVLLPVWMLNPSQVADSLPMSDQKIDFLLFDEATQIPLASSLGALQRCGRVLVVGDTEQMTPQNYFKAGDSEPIDLLHQASYTWKKHMLKQHYRSENPELIAFSNRHFYDNQLLAFPTPDMKSRVVNKHYVKEGVYSNRINPIEANRLVDKVRPFLSLPEKVGIVAFSETQLMCLFNTFEKEEQQIINDKIEKGELFLKALENLQGDECDHLFVSFGYGPDPEGKVLLNFGPLNRKSGRRRLNVLFTRARKSIDFFTSLNHDDLVISQNDSLNLLRQFMLFCEQDSKDKKVFPYDLKGKFDHSSVSFPHIFLTLKKATELINFHRVLKSRGWTVQYE
ncbi:MAG: DUF4011 domain-containing protein [Bacteroidetes bacterium]|nr:DUF4011 domain-containing protein [Bacteroidota bacterium]